MPLFIKIELSGRQSRQSIRAHVITMGFYTFCRMKIITFLSIHSVPPFLIVPIL